MTLLLMCGFTSIRAGLTRKGRMEAVGLRVKRRRTLGVSRAMDWPSRLDIKKMSVTTPSHRLFQITAYPLFCTSPGHATFTMAAASVASYFSDHLQRLPMLQDARDGFLKVAGDMLVADVLKDFFVNAGMDRTFGLSIAHPPLRSDAQSKAGRVQRYLNPLWTAGISGMREPQPWAFDDDELLKPTEFRYAEKQDAPWTKKELALSSSSRSCSTNAAWTRSFGWLDTRGTTSVAPARSPKVAPTSISSWRTTR
ncbi:uncharacterized protein EI97DRAFT_318852 [Westerdykella ornata]|uniref:Uncharacterized protein n=1 Tax=Westerdykella ornata TaxID=318751 RepID=A0A6A6JM10_WESOR|nr:uncharacterized protein EI97DRAFT_318852 [Westerdykella ornata]KAF2276696.1 hypothetical protein EI97DRAFT_318852 [Westerdykella ornata]